jgi:hypothetical protein
VGSLAQVGVFAAGGLVVPVEQSDKMLALALLGRGVLGPRAGKRESWILDPPSCFSCSRKVDRSVPHTQSPVTARLVAAVPPPH